MDLGEQPAPSDEMPSAKQSAAADTSHRASGAQGALPRRHRRRVNRSIPTGKKQILNTLTIHYGERIEAAA
jgi:hypothetical protein